MKRGQSISHAAKNSSLLKTPFNAKINTCNYLHALTLLSKHPVRLFSPVRGTKDPIMINILIFKLLKQALVSFKLNILSVISFLSLQ